MGGRLVQSRFIRFGVPFLTLVVGGSFGLKEFAQIRYDFRNRKNITKEEASELGIKMKDQTEVTLETEFEKIQKIVIWISERGDLNTLWYKKSWYPPVYFWSYLMIDTDSWENVRGPRPWEEGNRLYEDAVQRSEKMVKKDS